MIHLSPETMALARRLAAAQGVSMEDAVKLAVEQSAREMGLAPSPPKQRDVSSQAVATRKRRIDETVQRISELPILDPRTPREIVDDINAL
jgi:antitoxin VapB